MARDERRRDVDPPADVVDRVDGATDGAGVPHDGPGSTPPTMAPPLPLGQRLARVALLAIAFVFAVFAAFNAQHVGFDWIFGGTEVVEVNGERVSGGVPLIVLLVGSFALGAIVAWLGGWRGRRKRLRAARRTASGGASRG